MPGQDRGASGSRIKTGTRRYGSSGPRDKKRSSPHETPQAEGPPGSHLTPFSHTAQGGAPLGSGNFLLSEHPMTSQGDPPLGPASGSGSGSGSGLSTGSPFRAEHAAAASPRRASAVAKSKSATCLSAPQHAHSTPAGGLKSTASSNSLSKAFRSSHRGPSAHKHRGAPAGKGGGGGAGAGWGGGLLPLSRSLRRLPGSFLMLLFVVLWALTYQLIKSASLLSHTRFGGGGPSRAHSKLTCLHSLAQYQSQLQSQSQSQSQSKLRSQARARAEFLGGPCAPRTSMAGAQLALFTVPLLFTEEALALYQLALQSWLRLLDPTPQVYLVGNHSRLHALTQLDPDHVHVEADVDVNLEGAPQMHSVLARAAAAWLHADAILLVDPTVVLFPDILAAASKVASRFPDWVLLGGTWTLPARLQAPLLPRLRGLHSLLPLAQAQAQSQAVAHTLFLSDAQPQSQPQSRSQSQSQSQPQTQSQAGSQAGSQSRSQYEPQTRQQREALEETLRMQALVRRRGRLKASPSGAGPRGGGHALSPFLGFLMWSATGTPLLPVAVPPFAAGRGAHEEWLVHHLAYRVPAQGEAGPTQEPDAFGTAQGVRMSQPGTGWAEPGAGRGPVLSLEWELASGRQAVDASAAVLSLRLRPRGVPGAGVTPLGERGRSMTSSMTTADSSENRGPFRSEGIGVPKAWEVLSNAHLAASSGTGRAFTRGSLAHCPWALTRCFLPLPRGVHLPGPGADGEVAPGTLCLVRRERPGNCSCEHSVEVRSSTRDAGMRPGLGGYACGRTAAGSGAGGTRFPLDPLLAPLHFSSSSSSYPSSSSSSPSSSSSSSSDTPYGSGRGTSVGGTSGVRPGGRASSVRGLSLEELLPLVADGHRTVVLVAVVGSYAELAMSFVCMLRRLGVSNVLIAALDEAMYRYAFLQGLAVFDAQDTATATGTGTDTDTYAATATAMGTGTGTYAATGTSAGAGLDSESEAGGQREDDGRGRRRLQQEGGGLQTGWGPLRPGVGTRQERRRLQEMEGGSRGAGVGEGEGGASGGEGDAGAAGAPQVVLRSKIVARILRLGYSVLLSDPDVVWFKDPRPDLRAMRPGALLVQSNEPVAESPPNRVRRLNSGFFFAPARPAVVRALDAIVGRALAPGGAQTEQAAFYDVLCGPGGEYRVGEDSCVWPPSRLDILFLDRQHYPNGAIFHLWQAPSVREECARLGCYVLHNNFITGRKKKLARMKRKGFWFYDARLRMCKRPWLRSTGIQMTS